MEKHRLLVAPRTGRRLPDWVLEEWKAIYNIEMPWSGYNLYNFTPSPYGIVYLRLNDLRRMPG